MSSFVSILVLLSVVAMPVHLGRTGDCSDCCEPESPAVLQVVVNDDCCPPTSPVQDPTQDSEDDTDERAPGDCCKCPLRCCTSVNPNPILGQSVEVMNESYAFAGEASATGLGIARSPHLDSIKRPPRA
ncbi:MAG: hypothetical protein ED559_08865 [Phycisphaera sp.]|nr:MAG: hypothetical protein ED559_08865 [Phycisphaera sp.]